MSPGVVQTGKRREHRAAVLVTTRRSTESQRSGRKRDFKFRKSRKEKNVHLKGRGPTRSPAREKATCGAEGGRGNECDLAPFEARKGES
jgi:hypothetical protein